MLVGGMSPLGLLKERDIALVASDGTSKILPRARSIGLSRGQQVNEAIRIEASLTEKRETVQASSSPFA